MYQYPDYLMHHGIPGMKWGVRKQRTYDTSTAYGRMKTAKQQYKSDKKAYNKSFNKAYYHNHAYSLSKKKREASRKRWEDVKDKVDTLNSSKKAYKSAKKEYKDYKKSINKGKSSNAKELAVTGVALALAMRPIAEMSAQYAVKGAKKIADMAGYVDHTNYNDLGRQVIELGKRHYKVS